jgi:hypothetical protein
MPYPDIKAGAVTPFGGVGAAAARAGELAGAMGKTANFVTIARVRLDKSEGSVNDIVIPGSAGAPLALPERLRTKTLEISR